jgi:hypothetical protein
VPEILYTLILCAAFLVLGGLAFLAAYRLCQR